MHASSVRENYRQLKSTLGKLEELGLNAVWLINAWSKFQAKPVTEPAVFNEANFRILTDALDAMRARGLKAILPLNYFGRTWGPEGIDCNFLSDSQQSNAFVNYATGFLQRIAAYSDMVYIVVFAEAMHPCESVHWRDGKVIAQLMQRTLGVLPSELPASLRARFTIGFHDWGYVPQRWGKGTLPLATPLQYDFVSCTLYYQDNADDSELKAELDARLGRLAAAYPGVPRILGEFGGDKCLGTASQARVVRTTLEGAQNHGAGVNIWGFHLLGSLPYCTETYPMDHRIANSDGSWRPAGEAYRASITTPQIQASAAGVTTSYVPWSVWVRGTGLEPGIKAELYDQDGHVWASDISTAIAPDRSFISFRLPRNTPPSACNDGSACTISLTLALASGRQSRRITLLLPQTN